MEESHRLRCLHPFYIVGQASGTMLSKVDSFLRCHASNTSQEIANSVEAYSEVLKCQVSIGPQYFQDMVKSVQSSLQAL